MRQRGMVLGDGGCAGSQGPGDDEPGGVGEEPRCSAWLMRKARELQRLVLHLLFVSVFLLFFPFFYVFYYVMVIAYSLSNCGVIPQN